MNESLAAAAFERILQSICGEYLEMPALRLTRAQARRLWGLDEQTCAQLLEGLTESGFLYRLGDGTYARRSEVVGAPPARMVKAAGRPATSSTRRDSAASQKRK